ncbi:carbohydrate esterase family 12 protein [Diplodia corticola]|uniref:Carbohydrate esterase family 12 protein n=1 Tax=Diplodia corticola TaxID=236234 RepID=A0A1J9RNH9_9PEZI|nr:carbohydrate esterase family 12 protein [Diplodia corticola]OJD29149.1 carbohydrate esterase family 12 protein [Diplodia corticola]
MPSHLSKLLALPSIAAAATAPAAAADLPAAFFLAGDSTTATDGGWGDAFLAATLAGGAWGTNFAKGGATTASFRAGGYWDSTIAAVRNVSAGGEYEAWVTIQFGHNDQKASANITIEEFSANLGAFVDEVRDAGGNPILVSSLSRRGYSGDPERIVENLANETAAALAVAEEKGALSIDLNRASTDYLNAIGSADAWTYNLTPDDKTHLNEAGAAVFGNMVAWLLDNSAEGGLLAQYSVAGDGYVQAFESGTFIAE